MLPNMMQAAAMEGIKNIKIRDMDIPKPKQGEVLIKVKSVGICGSDMHFYINGRIGHHIVELPFILGHEASGEIVETGKDIINLKVGDRITMEPGVSCGKCNYCMTGKYNLCNKMIFWATPPIDGVLSEYIVHDERYCFKIPDNISFDEGAMAEPLSVAVHAAIRSRVNPGSKVAILGAGPIGQLVLQVFRAFGAYKIIISDISEYRLDIAKKIDDVTTINAAKVDVKKIVKDYFTEGADITVETAGAIETASDSIYITKKGGTVIQIGNLPKVEVPYPLLIALDKELTILGSYRYANCYPTVVDLLSSKKVHVKDLITRRFPFIETDEAFKFAYEERDKNLKTMIYFE